MQPSSELELTAVLQGLGSLSEGAPQPSRGTVVIPVASGDSQSSFLTLWESFTSGALASLLAAMWDVACYVLPPGES